MMGEVNTIFTKADAKMIDDTKTVGELLWGFTDPIFDQEWFNQNQSFFENNI